MTSPRVFVPDYTKPATEERGRLWTLANTRYANDDDMYARLCELDSELFEVWIKDTGQTGVAWREDA